MTSDVAVPDDAALAALARDIGAALSASDRRLALAESCTGGWIAKVLTDIPGSSHWFEAGFVTYSNPAKIASLGVSSLVLDAEGAVSESVAREMADGARRKTGADAAIAVSGVAGPGGGTQDKPVGLVWFGFSLDDREWARRAEFAGSREDVRRQSVALALETLLDAVTG